MGSLLSSVGRERGRVAGVSTFLLGGLIAARILRNRVSSRSNTLLVDAAHVDSSVSRIVHDGPDRLCVIMDFDRTITKYWDPSRTKRAPSSHGILERGRSAVFRAKADALTEFYFPIETDASLPVTEKIPFMIDWYRKVHGLFVAEGLTRADVVNAVSLSSVELRPGVVDTIQWCERHRVPLIVMSAGLGDVITEVLRQHLSDLPPCVHVVSNAMEFDSSGALVAFTEPVMHMFNKRLQASDVERLAAAAGLRDHRRNYIIVGDSPGDATMADGLDATTVLKIGLLNDAGNSAALLPRYRELFDVLLLGDTGLEPLVAILESVAE